MPTPPEAPTPPTPAGVIAALAHACQTVGIPYGDPAHGELLVMAAGPAGTARIGVARPGGAGQPEILARFALTVVEDETPARQAPPPGVPHHRCPSATGHDAIPHPGHLHVEKDGKSRPTRDPSEAGAAWCDGELGLTAAIA